MKIHQTISMGFIICATLISAGVSDGFNDNAHEALSRRAVNPNLANASQLDNFLKGLGSEFPDGIEQVVSGGKTVVQLIAAGAVQEDHPAQRVLNHFHDPTRTWGVAGFRFLGTTNPSSIVWSQSQVQGAGATYSWKTARDAYFNALTSTTDSERKHWYAETFVTLGHLIHHVQDAAVPSHTRNDSHLAPSSRSKLPDGDPFHYWAEANVAEINASPSLRFDPSILNQPTANPLAPVPIARIIDKTDGDSGVLSPNLNIGLAEYSNANFISKDKGLDSGYLYPRINQLAFLESVETTLDGKRLRYARFRPGFGEQDYRVGVLSRVVRYVQMPVGEMPIEQIGFGLDDIVHQDYGRKLFPRAIGYSAGLIDYFFRGSLFGSLCSPEPNWPREAHLGFWVTRPEDELGPGEFFFVVPYFVGSERRFVVSAPTPGSLTMGFQELVFDFSADPIPPFWDSANLMVVFRGHFEQEEGAVVVGEVGVCG